MGVCAYLVESKPKKLQINEPSSPQARTIYFPTHLGRLRWLAAAQLLWLAAAHAGSAGLYRAETTHDKRC